jgi:hypothetical protein
MQGLVIRPPGERLPEEIPPENRILVSLGAGQYQVIDKTSCYNGAMEHGHLVECENVRNQANIEDRGTT